MFSGNLNRKSSIADATCQQRDIKMWAIPGILLSNACMCSTVIDSNTQKIIALAFLATWHPKGIVFL